jgi:hypothetical protein
LLADPEFLLSQFCSLLGQCRVALSHF